MNEILHEVCDWRTGVARIDRAAGVLRGVKILGLESRNGRRYRPRALADAAALYEGAKVNVDHPARGAHEPRHYQDRLGVIRGVTFRAGEGLFGDLYYNPHHALAEQLLWDAEHAPENVGLSHNVEARTARHGERTMVEAILRVTSVDLVADPATTRGLFEAATARATGDLATADHTNRSDPAAPPRDRQHITLAEATAADIDRLRPDLREEIHGAAQTELAALRQKLAELEAAGQRHERTAQARRLLAEYNLPDPATATGPDARLVGASFLSLLEAAADEQAMRELVRERAELIAAARRDPTASRCRSRDQRLVEGAVAPVTNGAELARALRAGWR